ncbi:hypothetical protein AOR10_24570, partial [Vibrio alginolyticus]
ADQGVPLGPVVDRQQAVVAEEAHEELQREVAQVAQARRPDRRPHGQQVAALEGLAEGVALEPLTQRHGRVERAVVHGPYRLAIEAQDLAQQAVEAGAQQVAALGEQAGQGMAVVLEVSARLVYREAHLGGLGEYSEALHQPLEVRIGPVVEDDEAGIDGVVATFELHIHG